MNKIKVKDQYKYPAIILLALWIVITVVVIGESVRQGQKSPTHTHEPSWGATPAPIVAEAAVFQGLELNTRFTDQELVTTRTLATYYERRAFPGAPPVIPHPVEGDMTSDFKVCADCHAKGGYVPRFGAYTPITPHEAFANCRQCHVPQVERPLLKAIDWQTPAPPALGRAMLAGGPPPIPHTLQLRENCSACHTGPAAPVEIRTGHPERVNCRQCHVQATIPNRFERP